jgi:hypothetical protein
LQRAQQRFGDFLVDHDGWFNLRLL